MHAYRVKRNDVLHDLIKQISKPKFDEELYDACTSGSQIINSQEFKEMAELIDVIEEKHQEKTE